MTEKKHMLVISEDFSKFPAGRIKADGDFNGTRFRVEYLVSALHAAIADKTRLIVSLDGLKSCGSSFLEEAFGGLVRVEKFSKSQLDSSLRIICTETRLQRYKDAIERHIEKAKPE